MEVGDLADLTVIPKSKKAVSGILVRALAYE